MNNKELGEIIRKERKRRGLKQRQLEKLSGVSQGTISRIENGIEDNRLSQLLDFLDIPLYYLSDDLENKLCSLLPRLHREDRLTLLRLALRLANTPETSSRLMTEFFVSASGMSLN